MLPPRVKILLFALYAPAGLGLGFGLLGYLRYIQPWLARMLGSSWAWTVIAAYAGAAAAGCFFARRIYFEWTDEAPPPPGTIHMFDGYEGEAPFPVEVGRSIDPEENTTTFAPPRRHPSDENGPDVS
ncbi:hypothetical protein M2360_004319 [Rhizobium sp. SG_E_25_P2]|uniref:hypothetical protein n=1 Tax=Rhizobium sp. SG_E_25_P2 TaxID=2879942 RepID=UPI0024730047|nr:hypothetical protein [Rhizobium sp. SG_E_25_P2]MDH6268900.1 hypothetical protein [Rhizobium sp. SG_E_25_P2]